jgi:hypothetical protein
VLVWTWMSLVCATVVSSQSIIVRCVYTERATSEFFTVLQLEVTTTTCQSLVLSNAWSVLVLSLKLPASAHLTQCSSVGFYCEICLEDDCSEATIRAPTRVP